MDKGIKIIHLDGDDLPANLRAALMKVAGVDEEDGGLSDTLARVEKLRVAGYSTDEACLFTHVHDTFPALSRDLVEGIYHVACHHEILSAARLMVAIFSFLDEGATNLGKVDAKAGTDFLKGISAESVKTNWNRCQEQLAKLEAKYALAKSLQDEPHA